MTMMENTVSEPEAFDIFDGQRPVTVKGWLLAETDSQNGNSVRWTELSLYRTPSGRYVLATIGRSDVFHDSSCTQSSKGKRYETLSAAGVNNANELARCEKCRPGGDPRPVFVEQDIHAAQVLSTAADVSNALFRPGDSSRFLSRLARELLSQAAKNDSEIAALLNTPIEID